MIRAGVYFLLIFLLAISSCKKPQALVYDYDQTAKRNLISRDAYLPWDENNIPIKTIRLVSHVILKNDSTGNFPVTFSTRYFLSQVLMGHMNSWMAQHKPLHLESTSQYIKDTRIRFVMDINHVFFHADEEFYDISDKYAGSEGRKMRKKYVEYDSTMVHKEDAIHIFWIGIDDGALSSGIGDKSFIIMDGGERVDPLDTKRHPHEASKWLKHELGHSFGLLHTFPTDDCDDTPVNLGCWSNGYPADNPACSVASSNIMDYNAYQYSISECQIAKVHWALDGNLGNISDVVVDEWNVFDSNTTFLNSLNDTIYWKTRQRFKGNIEIPKNKVLIISAPVDMPKEAVFILGKKSKIIQRYPQELRFEN
jgi:hypothetical protein